MKKYTGKTSTAIIPYPDNKILLIKRNTRPFNGYWALPGGRMDPGETLSKQLSGKLKRKQDLTSTIVCIVGEYVEKGVKDDVEYEYYPTCFVVKPIGGEIKKQESEIQEIQLFSLNCPA